MKFLEIPEQLKPGIVENINKLSRDVIQVWNYWLEHCVKFVSFTNAGGIIAMLTFMNSRNIRFLSRAGLALSLFAVGLILTGIFILYMFLRFKLIYEKTEQDVDDFYSSKIKWGQFAKKVKERKKFHKPPPPWPRPPAAVRRARHRWPRPRSEPRSRSWWPSSSTSNGSSGRPCASSASSSGVSAWRGSSDSRRRRRSASSPCSTGCRPSGNSCASKRARARRPWPSCGRRCQPSVRRPTRRCASCWARSGCRSTSR